MNVLLDTHVFFWAVTTPDKLSVVQLDVLTRGDTIAFVSAVTAREIAMKVKLGKWQDAGEAIPYTVHYGRAWPR